MELNPKNMSECQRAWVEVDLDALAHNASELKKQMRGNCELMAIVKADAYGHGYEKVALRLQREGVTSFAVATVREGVRLREINITENILILSYTRPDEAWMLHAFSLAQLVSDGAYAKALDNTELPLNIHVAIDSGMHRLGIEPKNFDEIESIFNCKNLTIEGIATHFASCDSPDAADAAFTNLQIGRFFDVVQALKKKGYYVGKIHAQSSYGIVNYPSEHYDYARSGILLYGVQSEDGCTLLSPSLLPVLSLRAVIAQVRWIEANESVGYSRTYTTDKPTKLATVCIGYADGIPRQLSGKGGMCLIGGKKVPIIGRVSMDMVSVDVSEVENVSAGDIATFIGRDKDAEIRCEDVAKAAGTITNDVLSRLGTRLPRVYLEESNFL